MEIDDSTAVEVLRRIAQSRLTYASERGPSDAELRTLLSDTFNVPAQTEAFSEGELARSALKVLRQDPSYSVAIEQLADPATVSYEPVSLTIAVGVAAIMALRTRLRFKMDSTGKWSLDIDKQASGDETVKELIRGVVASPVS